MSKQQSCPPTAVEVAVTYFGKRRDSTSAKSVCSRSRFFFEVTDEIIVRIPSWIDVLSWLVLVFLYDTSPVVESTAYFFPILVGRSLHSEEGCQGSVGGQRRNRVTMPHALRAVKMPIARQQ